LFELLSLLEVLVHLVDAVRSRLDARLNDLVSDFFLIENHYFFDRTNAALQILADSQHFIDNDRRTRNRLQNAKLSALDSLRNLNFTFTGKQGNGSHLAQIHADGIVGFFQSAGSKVEFYVLAGLDVFEFVLEIGAWHLRSVEDVDTLRSNRSKQIIQIIRRMDVVGNEIVDLPVGEVPLLLACVDQFLNVVEFVVKRQMHSSPVQQTCVAYRTKRTWAHQVQSSVSFGRAPLSSSE